MRKVAIVGAPLVGKAETIRWIARMSGAKLARQLMQYPSTAEFPGGEDWVVATEYQVGEKRIVVRTAPGSAMPATSQILIDEADQIIATVDPSPGREEVNASFYEKNWGRISKKIIAFQITKADVMPRSAEDLRELLSRCQWSDSIPYFVTSAVTGRGMDLLLRTVNES